MKRQVLASRRLHGHHLFEVRPRFPVREFFERQKSLPLRTGIVPTESRRGHGRGTAGSCPPTFVDRHFFPDLLPVPVPKRSEGMGRWDHRPTWPLIWLVETSVLQSGYAGRTFFGKFHSGLSDNSPSFELSNWAICRPFDSPVSSGLSRIVDAIGCGEQKDRTPSCFGSWIGRDV